MDLWGVFFSVLLEKDGGESDLTLFQFSYSQTCVTEISLGTWNTSFVKHAEWEAAGRLWECGR